MLAVAACSPAEQDRLSGTGENHQAEHEPLVAPETGQSAAPRLPAQMPEAGPTPQKQAEQTAATQVLHRYFALIDAGRADEAAKLWWDEARAKAFAARLGKYADFDTNIAAPQRVQGAAGSLYVRISMQLLGGGSRSLADGTATLRRVNDVPGSTAEQRNWRIQRITLQPPPVPLSRPAAHRFLGSWASSERNCANRAWRFTADRLTTPAGSVCQFRDIREVPGGYDITAQCTAEGPPAEDVLQLRFAESARALLFESDVIADAGLVRCP